jgi:hypothetical protein
VSEEDGETSPYDRSVNRELNRNVVVKRENSETCVVAPLERKNSTNGTKALIVWGRLLL